MSYFDHLVRHDVTNINENTFFFLKKMYVYKLNVKGDQSISSNRYTEEKNLVSLET